MKVLHIDSSVTGANSVSRQLTKRIVSNWLAAHPSAVVDYLDLAAVPPGHLSNDALGFRQGPGSEGASEAQQRENALSEALVAQFLAADVVVIGAPMYNFSVSSQLKAWIDRVAQVGRTFKYTSTGPVGLAGGKTVIVVSVRGGVYSTTEAGRARDHQESYLQTVFAFFGVADLRFIRAEGMAMGEAAKVSGLQFAERDIASLTKSPAAQPSSALA